MFGKKNKNAEDNGINELKNIKPTSAPENSGAENEIEELVTYLRENWENGHINVLLVLFSKSCRDKSDFMVKLSVFLSRALQYELISAEELAILGIDTDETKSLIDAVTGSSSIGELEVQLNVRAAIKEYEKNMMQLMIENDLDTAKYEEFKLLLVKFAADNSMSDLNVAFKFLKATDSSSIAVFNKEQQ